MKNKTSKIENLEARIEAAVSPIFIPFKQLFVEKIKERIIEKYRVIACLDDNQKPIAQFVKESYQKLEQEIAELRSRLTTISDASVAKPELYESFYGALTTRFPGNAKYETLLFLTEKLLINEAKKFYLKYGLNFERKQGFTTFPSHIDVMASFSVARKLMKEGSVENGIAIGPEGFSYASIFKLFGLDIKSIHIDEYCRTEDRPYKELDNLASIKGRRVLFIEDDVRTGRTLAKAYSKIAARSPASVSLYLGHPEKYQVVKNIPSLFKKVYLIPNNLADKQLRKEIDAAIKILEKNYRIFKDGLRSLY